MAVVVNEGTQCLLGYRAHETASAWSHGLPNGPVGGDYESVVNLHDVMICGRLTAPLVNYFLEQAVDGDLWVTESQNDIHFFVFVFVSTTCHEMKIHLWQN